MPPSHSLLECAAVHCWRLSMARPGPGVKRAKTFIVRSVPGTIRVIFRICG